MKLYIYTLDCAVRQQRRRRWGEGIGVQSGGAEEETEWVSIIKIIWFIVEEQKIKIYWYLFYNTYIYIYTREKGYCTQSQSVWTLKRVATNNLQCENEFCFGQKLQEIYQSDDCWNSMSCLWFES